MAADEEHDEQSGRTPGEDGTPGGGRAQPDPGGGRVHTGGGGAQPDPGGGGAHPGGDRAHPHPGGGRAHPQPGGSRMHTGGGGAQPDPGGGRVHTGGGGAQPDPGGGRVQPGGDGARKSRTRKGRGERMTIEVCGRELQVSNPGKVFFPERGHTKLDLVEYYLACEQAVVRHLAERPSVLKRWVDGLDGEPFFQKRVPDSAPEWLQTATVTFPSGRHARELVVGDGAHLVWGVNLGVIDWNPWPVRRADLDHPDELRIDLDPGPDVPFARVREVALGVREVLDEHGMTGYPKTSGSRGVHVYVRIVPEHGFTEVRRAALALAREVERRMPGRATSRWWKEEREGVFIDYNQNARDRTIASAYSVRAVPDARVSCPLHWSEVPDVEPGDLRIDTVPDRLREHGDPSATIDDAPVSLDSLLALAARDEREGLGDAPWPPHFRKQRNEPKRVQPSRARKRPESDS